MTSLRGIQRRMFVCRKGSEVRAEKRSDKGRGLLWMEIWEVHGKPFDC